MRSFSVGWMLLEQLPEVKTKSALFARWNSIMWILPDGDAMLRMLSLTREAPGSDCLQRLVPGKRMADAMERRRTQRYGVGGSVKIIVPPGHSISGTIQNVSQGGMLVAVPEEMELGRTYEIEVTDSQGTFRLNGEALRLHLPPRSGDERHGSEFGIGFEFVGIDAAARERLGQLLEETVA
jgi:hypothetical protein